VREGYSCQCRKGESECVVTGASAAGRNTGVDGREDL
jgi:hypothetical protein